MKWFKNQNRSLQFSILFTIVWVVISLIEIMFSNANSQELRLSDKLLSPLSNSLDNEVFYILGSDELGRDVLASLMEGASNALFIGLFSVIIAALIGIFTGSIAAYFGDNTLDMYVLELIIKSIGLLYFLFFIVFLVPWFNLEFFSIWLHLLLPSFILFLLFFISKSIRHLNFFKKKIKIPVDLIVGRLIEIFESLPTLFILVALSTIISGSWLSISLIIGFTSWPTIAKFTRAEFLKIKQDTFIEASYALGLSKTAIILKHFLPNAISPVIITLAFGVANAVIIESTLAFLGLGLNAESASWGHLLASARLNQEAWWLVLFPSIAIFLVVYSCSNIGEKLKL